MGAARGGPSHEVGKRTRLVWDCLVWTGTRKRRL